MCRAARLAFVVAVAGIIGVVGTVWSGGVDSPVLAARPLASATTPAPTGSPTVAASPTPPPSVAASPTPLPSVAASPTPQENAPASPALPHGPRMLKMLSGDGGGRGGAAAPRESPLQPAASNPGDAHGLDVASYQHSGGPINWSQVAGSGYSFTYIKATEGTYYGNPYYSSDFAASRAAGMKAGAYEFAIPNGASGASEADYLLNAINYGTDGRTLPPMVDLEWDPYNAGDDCYGLSAASMISWIASFVNETRARVGKYPVIYTAQSWWDECTGNTADFSLDPLFIASYGTSQPAIPTGWNSWSIWQYTSTGSVPGISGSVDLDYFNGDVAALQSFVSGQPVTTYHPAPHPHYWVAVNGDGRLEAFLRGGDGQFWHAFETQSGNNASWSGWYPMGGYWAGEPSVALDSQGRLELFARGGDGQLWHAYETQADNSASWSGFYPLGGSWPRDPVAAKLPSGALEVYLVGATASSGPGIRREQGLAQAGPDSFPSAALGPGNRPSCPSRTADWTCLRAVATASSGTDIKHWPAPAPAGLASIRSGEAGPAIRWLPGTRMVASSFC